MIRYTQIDLVQLSKEGKTYKWKKEICVKCSRCMWGHGFTSRYFQSFSEPVYLKKYRCEGCKTVVTMRPSGFWPLLRTEISIIFKVLIYRFVHSGDPPAWPEGFPRQRGGYWLRQFNKYFKMNAINLFLNPIDYLYSLQGVSLNFFT